MRPIQTFFASFLAISLSCGVAGAHETFFLPVEPIIPGALTTLALSSAMSFPFPETGPKISRIDILKAKIAGNDQKISASGNTAKTLDLQFQPDRAGMLVVNLSLKPHPIELSASKVAEYFDEIGPSPDVRAAYDALPAPRRWREIYTKHAKLFACIAPCTDNAHMVKPSGSTLEFVAVDLTDSRHVRLLFQGHALVGQSVTLVDSVGKKTILITDSQGRVRAPESIRGVALFATTVLRPPRKPGAPFESDFATLSLTLPN